LELIVDGITVEGNIIPVPGNGKKTVIVEALVT